QGGEPAHAGHREVEDDGVRAPAVEVVEQLLARGGGALELDAVLRREDAGQGAADERRVVGDGDPDHRPTFREAMVSRRRIVSKRSERPMIDSAAPRKRRPPGRRARAKWETARWRAGSAK